MLSCLDLDFSILISARVSSQHDAPYVPTKQELEAGRAGQCSDRHRLQRPSDGKDKTNPDLAFFLRQVRVAGARCSLIVTDACKWPWPLLSVFFAVWLAVQERWRRLLVPERTRVGESGQ
jgi:hypothetical protein